MTKKKNAKRLAHVSESGELTPQQEEFCRQYTMTLKIGKSAEAAGYSPQTAESQGSRLMKQENVQAFIQKLMDERSKRTNISSDDVLSKINEIGSIDPLEVYDENGAIRPMRDIPAHIRRTISSIEVFEEFIGNGGDRIKIGETKKIKFWNKNMALNDLARHKKLLTDRTEVEIIDRAEEIRKARERSKNRSG